ncbi:unnamed protein product [Triticum turgidum subsp. durum]|uniref:Myb/SANT-like domain-containing protein n=1 Tax=Triticum turgidum subsp. durum TaxID=4567 RepID=A0A9R1SA16_TRITD|nr:unnamed protein product [Triticum turgidum subsp. durum]
MFCFPIADKRNRASWTTAQLDLLVSVMKEYADAIRFRGQNGWTKEGWNSMTTCLNNQFPRANFIVSQLKFREQRLKKEYFVVKSIAEKSGFGFDPITKMPTTIDEKWDELSKDQQKWRYKAFPYYDDLHAIYDAEGKGCKRTIDQVEEKFSPATDFSQGETFTQQVLNAAGLNSPSPTLPALGFEDQHYEWSKGIYDDDVEVFPVKRAERMENNSNHFPTEDMNTLPDPPPMKKARTSKGNDEGKPKRGKDTAIEDLVAVRKEELKTYVDVKTKQIESYREMKMVQMEKKDPDKDPYCIANCIVKLKSIPDLSASEHLKMIQHLKGERVDREIFMTVEHDVVLEILKEVLGRQI